MLIKSSELTQNEKLIIIRRRLKLTQAEMAAEHKISLYEYRRWESGETENPISFSIELLSDFESCFIMRRRSGMTVSEIATKIDVCRFWFGQMERGEAPSDRLVEYWAA